MPPTLNIPMFREKTLQDVIKGLRLQSSFEARQEFANEELAVARKELASANPVVKTEALNKIAHLRMMGYDTLNEGDDSTSFHVIEAMASSEFREKRLAMTCASRLLDPDSRVLLLATNTLKRQLQSSESYIVGLALGSLSCFASKDLARDLLPDVALTLTSPRPYVRKRGTLCLYRLCLQYPEGLIEAYDAIRARLEDDDQGVVSCAVNVVCELSRTSNAGNVLPLTPQLFRILTTSGNNWMLIKIVKLYAALLDKEPRLARKLLEPLHRIISTTQAKSLLWECVATVTRALRYSRTTPPALASEIVETCASKLHGFVDDSDPNLKYLGLRGFIELTKQFPDVALEHRALVVNALNDLDLNVRLRALELLAEMARESNCRAIVGHLLERLFKISSTGGGDDVAPTATIEDARKDRVFMDATILAVIRSCVPGRGGGGATTEEEENEEDFGNRFGKDFEWYFAVLVDLARLGGRRGSHPQLIAKEMVRVVTKVPGVRAAAAKLARRAILGGDGEEKSEELESGRRRRAAGFSHLHPEVRCALLFASTEYANDGSDEEHEDDDELRDVVTEALRRRCEGGAEDHHLDAEDIALVSAVSKLTTRKSSEGSLSTMMEESRREGLVRFAELAARCDWRARERFGPVHSSAQRRVPIPEGLNLKDFSFSNPEAPSEGSGKVRFRRVATTPRVSSSTVFNRPSSSSGHAEIYTPSNPGKLVFSGGAVKRVMPSWTPSSFEGSSASTSSPYYLGPHRQPSENGKEEEEEVNLWEEAQSIANSGTSETKRRVLPSFALASTNTTTTATSHTIPTTPVVLMASALPQGALPYTAVSSPSHLENGRARPNHVTLADIDVMAGATTKEEVTNSAVEGEEQKKKKKKKKTEDEGILVETHTETTKKKKKEKKKKDDEETSAVPPTTGDLLGLTE